MSIYTEKTLKKLRDAGWQAQVVEKWLHACKRRVDLFGIIDIVAIREGQILGVQSTSYNGRRDHLDEMLGEKRDAVLAWLKAGGKLTLVTWKKEKIKRGGVAFRYSPVVDIITEAFVEKVVGCSREEMSLLLRSPLRRDRLNSTEALEAQFQIGSALDELEVTQ